jgi:thymidine phosphorylase
VGDRVQKGQPLYTLHADSPGELAYAFAFVRARLPIVDVKEDA